MTATLSAAPRLQPLSSTSNLLLGHDLILTTASMAGGFPQFGEFPFDIRQMIWEQLIIKEPRVLPIRRNGKYGKEAGTQGWEFPFARNPVLLHINQESRAVALRKYTLLFPEPCRIDKNLYINRTCDVPFLLTTDPDSIDSTLWHEVDSDEEGETSDGSSAAGEERWTGDECRTWDMHWSIPGRMSSAFEILCKYGEVTRLALDYSNFCPLKRDVANLKVTRETPVCTISKRCGHPDSTDMIEGGVVLRSRLGLRFPDLPGSSEGRTAR